MEEKYSLGLNKTINIEETSDKNLKEELASLNLKLQAVSVMFRSLRKRVCKRSSLNNNDPHQHEDKNLDITNKDGIPLNTAYIGVTKNSKCPFILSVNHLGEYGVGNTKYSSLSSAAEAVSGVRRSGWSFWLLGDGRTLKEVYKDK